MSAAYANRVVLGRQPAVLWITPSKPNAWYGTIIEGRDLTEQQLSAMIEAGLSVTHAETIEVVRQATDREHYWPTNSLAPVFVFRCPVLRRRGDGKIDVIAPDGTTKRVFADGWANRPTGPKRPWL